MDSELATNLTESVLYRIVRGDSKRRSFGTPRNPRAPTMEEFNPRILAVAVGELSTLIAGVRHDIHPDQLERIANLADEELTRFRFDDPISATRAEGGLSLTGGHHRIHEVMRRVAIGRIETKAIIKILIHD
jgi:hypothetical protein